MALVVKHQPANAEDVKDAVSTPGLVRSPGEWNGNPLQYSCLENPVDRGAWWAAAQGSQKVGHNCSDLAHMHTHTPFLDSNYLKLLC